MILLADYTPGTESGNKNLKKIDPSRKMPRPLVRIGSSVLQALSVAQLVGTDVGFLAAGLAVYITGHLS
jgi:hypothetical protein